MIRHLSVVTNMPEHIFVSRTEHNAVRNVLLTGPEGLAAPDVYKSVITYFLSSSVVKKERKPSPFKNVQV